MTERSKFGICKQPWIQELQQELFASELWSSTLAEFLGNLYFNLQNPFVVPIVVAASTGSLKKSLLMLRRCVFFNPKIGVD